MAASPKINFLTLVSYSLLQTVLAETYATVLPQYKTSQTTDKQTDRQTDRQTDNTLDRTSDNTHMVCC